MAKIILDGIEREVVLERNQDGTFVTVDGRRYAVTDVSWMPAAVIFSLGQHSEVAYVSTGLAGTRISLRGRTYHRQDARVDADQLEHGAGSVRDGRVEAPMPGSIIELHVKEGDSVKAGAPMVVLESMKMHNEITAPVDGVVRSVNCKVGEQVSFGHVLVELSVD